MFYIILALYAIIIITFSLLSFFIVYHLVRYSINAGLNKILVPFFIIISIFLISSNILLFFATDWNGLLEKIFPY